MPVPVQLDVFLPRGKGGHPFLFLTAKLRQKGEGSVFVTSCVILMGTKIQRGAGWELRFL